MSDEPCADPNCRVCHEDFQREAGGSDVRVMGRLYRVKVESETLLSWPDDVALLSDLGKELDK